MVHFYGWVPTVTGNLSFSTIGRGSFPSRCVRIDSNNAFVVYQKRDLLDVLVPFAEDVSVVKFFREKIANWALRISGQFSFVLVGETEDAGEVCTGKVYLIAHKANGAKLKEAQRNLRLKDGTSEALEEFVGFISSVSCYAASFEIQRQGRLELIVERSEAVPTEVDGLLANQTFYFIKDISHVHQHHDPKHDAITEMTLAPQKDDGAWISDTQHALFRAIIRYKRFRNEKALFRASGILAYTKAFQNSYACNKVEGPKFSHAELEQSLAVSRSEIKHFDQKRLAKIETFRNFFFALFGLAISASYLARLGGSLKVDVDEKIVRLATSLAKFPLEAAGLTVLASSVWMILTHQVDPADSDIVRWATRVSQSFRLRYFMLSNVVLTGLLCWASYILISMSFG